MLRRVGRKLLLAAAILMAVQLVLCAGLYWVMCQPPRYIWPLHDACADAHDDGAAV
jgi:hypothetical protein